MEADRRFGWIRKGFAEAPSGGRCSQAKTPPLGFGTGMRALRYLGVEMPAQFRKFERIGDKEPLLLVTFLLLLVTCYLLLFSDQRLVNACRTPVERLQDAC